MSCARSRNRRRNLRRLDAVKFRESFFEISIALIRDFLLMIGGRLLVAAVKILNHVHARSYLAEWGETLGVVIESGVVAQIDENLRRTRIRTSRLSERNRAFGIGLRDRIVLDVGALPSLVDRGAPGQSKLHYEAGNNAKKFYATEIAVLDQIVETVSFIRSPRPRHLHDEITLSSRECGFINVRRFGIERCWVQQPRICSGVRSRLLRCRLILGRKRPRSETCN